MFYHDFAKKIVIGLLFGLSMQGYANTPPKQQIKVENDSHVTNAEYQAIQAEIRQISEEIRQLNQEIQQGKEVLRQVTEEQGNVHKLTVSKINLNSVIAPEIRYERLDSTLQQIASAESEQALVALNEEIHQLSEEIRLLNEEINKGKQELAEINQSINQPNKK